MVSSISSNVVTNEKKHSNLLPFSMAGLGVGAIGGGIYGSSLKPWMKGSEISDSFVKHVSADMLEKLAGTEEEKNVAKMYKKLLKLNITKDTPDEVILKFFKDNAELFQLDKFSSNSDEAAEILLKRCNGKDSLINLLVDSEKDLKYVLSKEWFDIDKGALKKLNNEATQEDKEIYELLSSKMKNLKTKSIVKMAAIGGAILAAVGLLAGFVFDKSKK